MLGFVLGLQSVMVKLLGYSRAVILRQCSINNYDSAAVCGAHTGMSYRYRLLALDIHCELWEFYIIRPGSNVITFSLICVGYSF